ncbi:hypothetical protein HBB16_13015 [Pseudonocardia sp. MCCB 268]|nr:hypothetical protein [Pseudonocardia cytotoxica]
MTAELAHGWPPHVLPEKIKEVFGPSLRPGSPSAIPKAWPAADHRRRDLRARGGVIEPAPPGARGPYASASEGWGAREELTTRCSPGSRTPTPRTAVQESLPGRKKKGE